MRRGRAASVTRNCSRFWKISARSKTRSKIGSKPRGATPSGRRPGFATRRGRRGSTGRAMSGRWRMRLLTVEESGFPLVRRLQLPTGDALRRARSALNRSFNCLEITNLPRAYNLNSARSAVFPHPEVETSAGGALRRARSALDRNFNRRESRGCSASFAPDSARSASGATRLLPEVSTSGTPISARPLHQPTENRVERRIQQRALFGMKLHAQTSPIVAFDGLDDAVGRARRDAQNHCPG